MSHFKVAHTIAVMLCIFSTSALANQWSTSSSKDQMTGVSQAHASSPSAGPTKEFDFPYHNVKGWLGFGCNGKDEWAYIGFTEAPNLTDTKPRNGGYSTFSTRIRWDQSVEKIEMLQEWGSKFLHFSKDKEAIAKISGSQTVLLELNWYGQSPAYFEFSLVGSTKAINDARKLCSGK